MNENVKPNDQLTSTSARDTSSELYAWDLYRQPKLAQSKLYDYRMESDNYLKSLRYIEISRHQKKS